MSRTTMTTTTPNDAGEEREALARELAAWMAAGYRESRQAWRWHRGTRCLARVAGLPVAEVVEDLQRDAEALAEEHQP